VTSRATSKPSIFLHFFASVDLYYFGMVDASHSMGRRCPGSASLCPYRLRVWSGQCAHCVVCVCGLCAGTELYYVSVLDSSHSVGRRRPGEASHCHYTLRVWSGQCVYWNEHTDHWSAAGCFLHESSTFDLAQCRYCPLLSCI